MGGANVLVGFGVCFAEDGGTDQHWLESAGAERLFLVKWPEEQAFVLQQAIGFLRHGDIFMTRSLARLGPRMDGIVAALHDIAAAGATVRIGDDIAAGSQQSMALLQASELLKHASQPAASRQRPHEERPGRAERRVRGRPAALTDAQRERVLALVRDQQMSARVVAQRFGVSPATIYRVIQTG